MESREGAGNGTGFNRGRRLFLGGVVGAGIVGALDSCGFAGSGKPDGVRGSNAEGDDPNSTTTVTPKAEAPLRENEFGASAYVQVWEGVDYPEDANLSGLEARIAFATPNESGGADLPPELNANTYPSVVRLLQSAGAVTLSLGGGGANDDERLRLHANWLQASSNPDLFAKSVASNVDAASERIGREVTGVDFDWEYPEGPDGITAIATAIKTCLPHLRLSAAVPAFWMADMYDGATDFFDMLNDISVMTYGAFGPYEPFLSGPIAPTDWQLDALNTWQTRVGAANAGKLAIGFPTYGYYFTGIDNYNQQVDNSAAALLYPEALAEGELIRGAEGSGSDMIRTNNGVISVLTPESMRSAIARAKEIGVNRQMIWSARGFTPEHHSVLVS